MLTAQDSLFPEGYGVSLLISASVVQILTVVDVSLSNAVGCVRLFPAVLALAKSFKGFASFARLLGDANPETQQMMSELDIKAVSGHLQGSLAISSQPVTLCRQFQVSCSYHCARLISLGIAGSHHALLPRRQGSRPTCGVITRRPDGADPAGPSSIRCQATASSQGAGTPSQICGTCVDWAEVPAGGLKGVSRWDCLRSCTSLNTHEVAGGLCRLRTGSAAVRLHVCAHQRQLKGGVRSARSKNSAPDVVSFLVRPERDLCVHRQQLVLYAGTW